MINFSGINYYSTLGRVMRKFLSLVPSNAVVPILQGPLRGMKWVVGSSTHGCWLGSYELEKQRCLAKLVKPGMVVYDIGAHVGFYTLYFATLTGPSGKVYAFEPARRNLQYLYKHISLNYVNNIEVYEVAVAEASGYADFIFNPESSSTSHLSNLDTARPGIRESIRVIALDDFIGQGHPPPDFIKMDIEGAEFQALTGMAHLLRKKKPLLSISLHGRIVSSQCLSFLNDLKFEISDLTKNPLFPERYYDEILAW